MYRGFPDSSVGKETTCNARDPSSIPGIRRFPGDGIVYLLQYSWAPLVAQLVKNLSTMRETRVRSLGWENPLEKGSRILPWRIRHDWATFTSLHKYNCHYRCVYVNFKYLFHHLISLKDLKLMVQKRSLILNQSPLLLLYYKLNQVVFTQVISSCLYYKS